MFELPLFPLDAVLFPGTPLHLHIFEARYKQMISFCRRTGSSFGVVLIRRGVEAFDLSVQPHSVGCTAHIAHLQSLEQGRMNIVVVGQERFRVVSLQRNRPYVVGMVEAYPLQMGADQVALEQKERRLRPWLERYVRLLSHDDDLDLALLQVAREPLAYAYLAAMLLQIPQPQKQILLEINRASDLLEALNVSYRREVALLGAILQRKHPRGDLPFSLN